jgi:hypothetical protein
MHNFFSTFGGIKRLHTARFASSLDLHRIAVADLKNHTLGILLAKEKHNRLLAVRPTPKRQQLGNLGLFFPTGGGKTHFLTTQLLTNPQVSMLVDDPKRDLYPVTAGYRASHGNVFVIDPTGKGNCFDPLTGKQTEAEFYEVAKLLLYQQNEREPAFTEYAIKMLKLLFLLARRIEYSPFPFVRLMSQLGLTSVAKEMNAISSEIATLFLDEDYNSAKDYKEEKFLANSWELLISI